MIMNMHSFTEMPSDEQSGPLRYCGEMSVQLAPNGVHGQFVYKRTAGMWVERTFIDVLGDTVDFENVGSEVGSYQLREKTHNSDILRIIGERGIYRREEGKKTLKQIIATSIITQWNGADGPFLTNVQGNLFYFEQRNILYVIHIFRTTIVLEWNVNMWRVDKKSDECWEKGDLVFVPAVGDR